ncbi:MAG: phenylalanine--tRNA ligase subunit alpha [Prevotellaceae bacterium]|jgi:phenylalanyl-tRNA synthetase alpha chain|nr:phenylalanine--tRNA ligase subunit alpha [Prevotellaceae bacterium]
MQKKISDLLSEVEAFTASSLHEVEEFRVKLLGKKGDVTLLFDEFKHVSGDVKRELGQKINALKTAAQTRISELREALDAGNAPTLALDASRPGAADSIGTRHPVASVRNEILAIFRQLGFAVAEGPEIEDDWHVFGALNFPPEHPARDMQDTFFIEKRAGSDNPILLRTHTSSIQVRAMERQPPPIRIVCPGRVYRNEAISARAHCMFHQVEGLYVDQGVSFADLKQTLLYFAKEMFGASVQIRLRPSFFPFTEPSAELDVSCSICGGKGCNICKGTGWLEVGGCGMVDPSVLRSCSIDSQKYSGFAFGMGVERIAMLKYQARDLRLYFENDVRFLRQFFLVND